MTNILPVSFNLLYVFAGMVLIEFITFLIMVAKKKLNVLRIFFAVLSGNAFTTVLAMFIPAGNSMFGYLVWFFVAFALAVVFEWGFDIAFFRDREYTLSNLRFFFISLICNILSYSTIYLLNQYDVLIGN
ncbi:MAG: hypothetical protein IKQ46_10230 [Bacteroidales bacterium]|jgi:hypothetical protein|nr:hypothetical protein [Bacteroidales bacterium]MBR6278929.1 hypothetical protein [Bacteroidales bacterium]